MNQPAERNPTAGPEDDTELVRASQGGDQTAFGELVRRHQRAVYRLAYALTRNASDADDLAQETFVRAYQAIGRFRLGEPMMPWLSRITTNQAYTLFRRRRRRPEAPLEPLIEAGRQWSVDDDPVENTADAERSRQLRVAFDQLRPEQQAVLAMRVIQGLSYQEIANAIGVPIGTVMSRLSRARAELKLRWRAQTGEST